MIQPLNKISLYSFSIAFILTFINYIAFSKNFLYNVALDDVINLFFAIGLTGISVQIQKNNPKKFKMDALEWFTSFMLFFLFPAFFALILGIIFAQQSQKHSIEETDSTNENHP
tara:strand:+ start:73 stop:414 length:342 start_codon:yes stop_codon:yes gene_type:complete